MVQQSKKRIMLTCVIMCVLNLVFSIYNGGLDINYTHYGKNVFIGYLGGVIGTFMIFLLSMLMKWNSIIKTFSTGTILILAFHMFFCGLISAKIFVKNDIHFGQDIYSILIAFIVMVIMYPVILLVQRYFPLMIGIRR